MFDRFSRRRQAWLMPVSVLALASLTACSTHQDIQPALRALDADKLGVRSAQAVEVTAQVPPWWEGYEDRQLNALMAKALADSPNLQMAQARLRRVEALESIARGNDKPQIQAKAEVDRQKFSRHGMYPPPIAGSSLTSGTLQVEGSWELDLFGRQRAEIESLIGQKRAAQADVRTAGLVLSWQVARAYLELGRAQFQREISVRTLAQREEMLKLIRQRVQAGLDTAVELKQGEGALPDARAQVESWDEELVKMRHALAYLTGQSPQALDQLLVKDVVEPLPVPDHIPVDLLARRADVMAALWRAQAAGHQVDSARALFYPNVDLVSYAGYNSIGLDQLLKPTSLQWGLMPAIHLPLFDADKRVANLQGKVADHDVALATYNQTVLQAVQDVADQIAGSQSAARQRQEQKLAQQSAEAAYKLAVERYQAGLSGYLTVLSAESNVLAQRHKAIDLLAHALDAQINLIRALGGSLQAEQPGSPTASSDNKQAATQAGDRS
ncbi:MAG TPA: efflux transporter outer membrane subunit [Aquabacterium sp.]|uniref:efflux transporter outer membrane subunit n=1 Tax=Aquabacterium sp. TaxID=1872578 RepID=UPI002E30C130|nr:efflux transporter outer membrane subunit [Aquabacterium sp.]HEX5355932.1 efflux transporter outer membrane subunit [Aquabacterium sp.]